MRVSPTDLAHQRPAPHRLALVLACAVACGLSSIGCERGEPTDGDARPSVLLITVDTLRADHLGAYGEAATPALDRLARQGMVFERAATPMPLTRPAHFSILTSLYPREHGVLNNALALPDSATTLAEIFRAEGYRTGGFVAVALLSPESGAAQGFDEFGAPQGAKQRAGEAVVAEALDFIAAKGEPFFLWVHLFDPHLPYGPPEKYRDERASPLSATLPEVSWRKLRDIAERNAGDIPREVLDHAKALYRGEVSYVDHWTGELLEAFDRATDPDRSIVVFTADHGECFEDGIFFEHADCLHEGALRIPLIIRHADFAPGQRASAQVSSIDVAPSILRAAGIDVPASYSGVALQQQDAAVDRYVLIQHPFYQEKTAGGRSRRQKAIRSVAGEPTVRILVDEERVGIVGRDWKFIQAGDQTELYAQNAGGGEQASSTDGADGRDSLLIALRARLQEQLSRHELNIIDSDQINDELRETLRALGYLDAEEAGQGER